MTEILRPLTLGELLDRTITLYRRHALVFIGLVAVPSLLGLAARLVNTTLMAGASEDLTRLLLMFVMFLVLTFIALVVNSISQAATMIAVSRVHLGQQITLTDSFAGIRGRVIRICFITIALSVLIMFGFLLLIIPGLFLLLRWSLAVPAAVLEHLGLGRTMDRSATLVEGQYGRILMIYVLYFLMVMVFSFATQMPFIIILFLQGGSIAEQPLWLQLATDIGGFFTQCLVGPLLTIALALAYYDARVRKEAFDLQHMMAQLGPAENAERQPVLTS